MKNIEKILLFVSILLCISATVDAQKIIKFREPKRAKGVSDVLELRCEPLDTVRVAFIGLGMRGIDAVRRYMYLENVKVVALCDVRSEKVKAAQNILKENKREPAKEFFDVDAWQKVCELPEVDLVYVCTQWNLHTPIAVKALNEKKHVALEVPAATSIDECWQLVNAAENNRCHCIMLENCCYDFFEMATLNMAQKGVFGEIVHVEGAYIHDLRWLNFDDSTGYWNNWRLKHNTFHTGNLYPTHGLGPISQILNIHRGDKMKYLVSVSSNQFGMTAYAKKNFGSDDVRANTNYALGDMNTTIIKTQKGKTMMIQHDVTSPRPYSRIHQISGTLGFAQKYPIEQIAIEPNAHEALSGDELTNFLKKYEHQFCSEIGDKAREVGGHGGMDFIMDYRLVYCLHNGLPLDMDVYDAAEWSCLVELSEISTKHNGATVEIPDFTRGSWNKLQSLKFYNK